LLLYTPLAEAKNFRWASQGDAATLDPHSQNETFNNAMNNMVYEYLVMRDKDMKLVPALATSWTNPAPTKWIFNLRKGVKFSDGSPFTADDVVFSFNRARESSVTFKLYSTQAGIPRKIDDHTVEFTTPVPNPVMLDTINSIFVMSKAWCEKNNVAKPQDYTKKEETFAVRNAMGTGPYTLVTWEQGVKILHKKYRDGGIPAHQQPGHADGRDQIQSNRFRARPTRAGRYSHAHRQGHEGVGWPRGARYLCRLRSSARSIALLGREGKKSVQGQARTPGALSGH
jgi:ABC-type transport system substrate-binding protein